MKFNKIIGIVCFAMLLMNFASAYNEFPDLTSNWYLNDSNSNGLVNETDGVVDSWGSNDGILYGKTFNHGTNNDATLNNNLTGTITGATWKHDSELDRNVLSFDGDGDYVLTTSNSNSTELSVFSWINMDKYGVTSNEGVIASQGLFNWEIELENNDDIKVILNGEICLKSANIPLNEWNFIGFTFNNGEVNIYNNNNLIGTCIVSTTYTVTDDSVKLNLGRRATGGVYFNGSISDVIILDKALNSTEVLNLYNTGQVNTTGYYHEINFPLDEGTGTTVSTKDGKFRGYYEFDGVSDYIGILDDDVLDINPEITILANINPIGNGIIVSKGDMFQSNDRNTYGLYFTGSKIIFGTGNGTYIGYNQVESDVTVNLNEWNTVGGFKNITHTCVYVNNILKCIISNQDTIQTTTDNLFIGKNTGGSFDYEGSIDEVKIWNRALTQTEIQEEMNANAVANPEGIVAYYDFNERNSADTTVYDNNQLSTGARQSTASITDPVFKWDKAMNFDGVDDYVDIGSQSIDLTTDAITFSGWVKQDESCDAQSASECLLFGKRADIGVTIQSNGKIKAWMGGFATVYNTDIQDTGYRNIVVAYTGINSNERKVYLDGNLVGTDTSGTTGTKSYQYIGSEAGTYNFNGSIADVRIYDRALSEAEILTLYEGVLLVPSDLTPTNQSFNVDEGTKQTFEADVSWANTISWYLDGILQKIGASWDWFVGVQDADIDPEKQIIVLAENTTASDTYVYDVTVDQAFPILPHDINPKSGVYDSYIPIDCYINDDAFWFKNSTFDFQVYYDADWHYTTGNSSSPHSKAYVLHVTGQDDVQVRCRSFDGVYYSNWTDINTNLSIAHKKSKLELFDLSGVRRKTPYTQTAFNSHCKIDDAIDNEYINNIYIDCENDGIWDGVQKYNLSEQVKEDSLFSVCNFNRADTYTLNTGCVVQKTNSSKNWQTTFCSGLPKDQEYCNYNKEYLLLVGNTYD